MLQGQVYRDVYFYLLQHNEYIRKQLSYGQICYQSKSQKICETQTNACKYLQITKCIYKNVNRSLFGFRHAHQRKGDICLFAHLNAQKSVFFCIRREKLCEQIVGIKQNTKEVVPRRSQAKRLVCQEVWVSDQRVQLEVQQCVQFSEMNVWFEREFVFERRTQLSLPSCLWAKDSELLDKCAHICRGS